MTYYLAPSLSDLRDECNARWPERDKRSDGWIGDTSHQARPSDHNPDYSAGGVVRAIDIDVNDRTPESLVKVVLEAVIGDPRVWYVIYNRKIYSRTYGWQARTYTGSNPHTKHIHVSLRHTTEAESDRSPWFPVKKRKKRRVKPPLVDLSILRAEFEAARKGEPVTERIVVRRVQRCLNKKYGEDLTLDGYAGENTLDAYGRHEHRVGKSGRPRMPDWDTLPPLVCGMYRIED